jgi:GNAT superfamily N-acetyltransferase
MPLAVLRVTAPQTPHFEALVAIYTAAHPPSERKPLALLARMVQDPAHIFLVVTLEDVVAGFSITHLFPRSDACLLEYMAIAADRQGQGIGQFLFKQLVAMPEVSGRYLLAEVDSDKLESPDRTDRIRRKRFYRNLGCREVEGLNYLMPPVSTSTPPAMDILVYRRDLPGSIPRPQLRTWLQGIYANVYGVPTADPRIDKMIDPLPENPKLI